MLVLNRRKHEVLQVVVPPSSKPTVINVKVSSFTKSGRPTEMPHGFGVRVAVDAPREVDIKRSELADRPELSVGYSEIRDPLGVAECYSE